jgi:hypothetical protein
VLHVREAAFVKLERTSNLHLIDSSMAVNYAPFINLQCTDITFQLTWHKTRVLNLHFERWHGEDNPGCTGQR